MNAEDQHPISNINANHIAGEKKKKLSDFKFNQGKQKQQQTWPPGPT